jgi:hypothetical protein
LDKEGNNIKGHDERGDKNENGNQADIGRSDAPVKGKDQGNPDVEKSPGGYTGEVKEYAGLKGNKALEEIATECSTHYTLLGSSIPTENSTVEIMGNAPSTKKITYLSIRI